MFNTLVDYEIEAKPLIDNITHPCIKWYKKLHVARMDGICFNLEKPPKTWEDKIE